MADYITFKAFIVNKADTVLQVKLELDNNTTFYIDESVLHLNSANTINLSEKQSIIGSNKGAISIVSPINSFKDPIVAAGYISNGNMMYKETNFECLEAVGNKEGTGGQGSKQAEDSGISSYYPHA